jgi:hypothetical protein
MPDRLALDAAIQRVLALPLPQRQRATALVKELYGTPGVRHGGSVPTILDIMTHTRWLGAWFADASWRAWKAFLPSVFGLPMTDAAAAIYRRHTGRTTLPSTAAREAWVVAGVRAGKSRVAALSAVYLACFRDYAPYLAPGERAVVMVLAADRQQAHVVFEYVRAFLQVPQLQRLVAHEGREAVALTNGVTIEIHTSNFRSVRGYTCVAVICDEIAFWPTDESGANPDREILQALRPRMTTIPGAMLLCISSPYWRRGALWDAYRQHYGRDGDPVLVWQADTRSMNPTVDPALIAAAYEQDVAAAAAEYGAEFRRDIDTFVSREAVEACVIPGRHELAPVSGVEYVAFVDPSGGSQDSMTLAVAHAENRCMVLDCIREQRPPFNPAAVVSEFASTLRRYRVSVVIGDRYGGEWPRERFCEDGIEYRGAEETRSELYLNFLPMLNSGQVELLDHPQLVSQLCALERRTARGGKDSIDHAPGAHDDIANAAAGALVRSRPSVPSAEEWARAAGWLADTGPSVGPPRDSLPDNVPEALRSRLEPPAPAGGRLMEIYLHARARFAGEG